MTGSGRTVAGSRWRRVSAKHDAGRMLELRPNCECCGRDLPPDSADAFICSFECTWCRDCVDGPLGGSCPNCGGDLVPRPIRPAALLAANPPSTVRRLNAGCDSMRGP